MLGACFAPLSWLGPATAQIGISEPGPIERIARALGPLPSVTAIGRTYLAEQATAFAADETEVRLARRFAALGVDSMRATQPQLEQALKHMIETDLACGRQTTIARWVVAQTEADVSALYAWSVVQS
ncbi:hypothetical protein [Hyphomicrobium sp. CS1GBMeth3]|uniref:hypothetical protein n=1 Tax=Hyphomicrobium sp. CS1GBMeth3 TaxID=1892845 RepID=UPI0011147B9E|nr:hypothetical protein [Hyphomicrobium sp. CS1GBMeth3]